MRSLGDGMVGVFSCWAGTRSYLVLAVALRRERFVSLIMMAKGDILYSIWRCPSKLTQRAYIPYSGAGRLLHTALFS